MCRTCVQSVYGVLKSTVPAHILCAGLAHLRLCLVQNSPGFTHSLRGLCHDFSTQVAGLLSLSLSPFSPLSTHPITKTIMLNEVI